MTYEEILADLGKRIGIDLVPDQNNTCLVRLEDGLLIYLEPAQESEDLIIGIPLGTVAPGKGGERLLQMTLIANGKHRPFLGSFAYSLPLDQLILFERAPLPYIDGAMTFNLLLPLIEEARRWRDAVRGGTIPAL